MTLASTLTTLDTLAVGASATVIHLAPAPAHAHEQGMDIARRLMELGFVPGERIRVLRRAPTAGGPVAVRVGHSTFALRRFEASLVSVQPE